ncbi:hypothetical protein JTE90_008962 [Oedothorax gibbosus]|uniref:Uncharacterized protein n=1 Tax=Oedothorax gibbosus TaxID=931172 RepID=A0AAV6UVF1_9ARAC|nr:hypothetical protein JTE90_008962 [Oedothorax gibbosus]
MDDLDGILVDGSLDDYHQKKTFPSLSPPSTPARRNRLCPHSEVCRSAGTQNCQCTACRESRRVDVFLIVPSPTQHDACVPTNTQNRTLLVARNYPLHLRGSFKLSAIRIFRNLSSVCR